MKFLGTLLVAAILMTGTLVAQPKRESVKLEWESFNAGIEKAKAHHKKVLVDVYTDWCGWCKKMDAAVYSDLSVKEYLGKNFVVIKMNAEGHGTLHYKGQDFTPAQLAAAFGVNGYPTTLFLKEDSEPITVLPGYVEAPMFLNILTYVAEDQYQSKQFDEYLKEKGVKSD
ncbi:MAG TPA: thioredoxin fold domain-containing protein [Bacteroidota bacterium]|nr:thioredoxin fold domain-containing protein [Bacteroidota bacterium]